MRAWAAGATRGWLGTLGLEVLPPQAPAPTWLLPGVMIAWVIAARFVGLHRSRRMMSAVADIWDICRASFFVFLAAILGSFLFKLPLASRAFMVLLVAIGAGGLVSVRLLVRAALARARANGYNSRRLVIVGRDDAAESTHAWVMSHKDWGLDFAGFVRSTPEWSPSGRCLGNLNDLETILQREVVDEIIFTSGSGWHDGLREARRICRDMGVQARMLVELPAGTSASFIVPIEGHALMDLAPPSAYVAGMVAKRAFDIFVSGGALLVLSPVLLTVAAAVKLTSEGPVFFAQERVGKNGRTFRMLKFRSMVVNAEELRAKLEAQNEMDGPVFKIKRDPRITSVGHFIRKTSLDEFPQFINVLRGEMSVVGPRPPLPSEVAQYERWQRKRLSVKPGITCIWQISGRNDVTFEQWVKMDIDYIERWSVWLDLKIFFKTIPAVLLRRGAS